MCRIILVRHGEQPSKEDVNNGYPSCLTELGREQAKLLGKRLKSFEPFDVVSSSYDRAILTAHIICETISENISVFDDDLVEIKPNVYKDMKAWKHFRDIPEEMFVNAERQGNRAFEKYFLNSHSKDFTQVLVCHGNLISLLLCKCLKLNTKAWVRFRVQHCSISIVDEASDPYVVCVNDTGHIPKELLTPNC